MTSPFSRPLTPMRSVSELRATVEAFAARCAARRVAQGADKAPLLEAFARLQCAASRGDPAGEMVADRELHLAIVRLADVQTLQQVWEAAANDSLRAARPRIARGKGTRRGPCPCLRVSSHVLVFDEREKAKMTRSVGRGHNETRT